MNYQQIFDELKFLKDKKPGAFAKALEEKEKIIPPILKKLEDERKELFIDHMDGEYVFHINGFLILAESRVQKAFPLLCEYISDSSGWPVNRDRVGAFFAVLPQIIESCFNGDTDLLKKLVVNKEIPPEARTSVAISYYILCNDKKITRDLVEEHFSGFMESDNVRYYEILIDEIVHIAAQLSLEGLEAGIKKLYSEELINEFEHPSDSIMSLLFDRENSRDWKEDFARDLSNNPLRSADEILDELFYKSADYDIHTTDHPVFDDLKKVFSDNPKPVVRKDAKVGRNDPCPCGSGKKFKKCCGK